MLKNLLFFLVVFGLNTEIEAKRFQSPCPEPDMADVILGTFDRVEVTLPQDGEEQAEDDGDGGVYHVGAVEQFEQAQLFIDFQVQIMRQPGLEGIDLIAQEIEESELSAEQKQQLRRQLARRSNFLKTLLSGLQKRSGQDRDDDSAAGGSGFSGSIPVAHFGL